MRFVLALVVALFCACLQAGERQRCRLLSARAQSCTVVNSPCTVVNAAPAAVPVYSPIQPAAAAVPVYAAPVSSCPGGVCPAPNYAPVQGGLFRRW